MNTLRHIVEGGSGATLEPREYAVLVWLMEHPNKVHHRDDIARACDLTVGGRTVDTIISQVRKALGTARDNILCAGRKSGYAWCGDAVRLAPVAWTGAAAKRNEPMAQWAVMTQEEVAKRLGITAAAVSAIERKALEKLRKRPDILKAWRDLLGQRSRMHYDPFYECWLFSVQESIEDPYREGEDGISPETI